LRIPLNQTVIWDNDVSGCRFESDADLNLSYIILTFLILLNYFQLVFYNTALLETEIADHVKLPSITRYPTLYKYGQLYYKMNQLTGTIYLENSGLLTVPGEIHGSPSFRAVSGPYIPRIHYYSWYTNFRR
jgi:hypothetical protein